VEDAVLDALLGEDLQRLRMLPEDVQRDGQIVLARQPQLLAKPALLQRQAVAILVEAVEPDLTDGDDARIARAKARVELLQVVVEHRVADRADELRMHAVRDDERIMPRQERVVALPLFRPHAGEEHALDARRLRARDGRVDVVELLQMAVRIEHAFIILPP